MPSASSPISPTGLFDPYHNTRSSIAFGTTLASEFDMGSPNSNISSQLKKRRVSENTGGSPLNPVFGDIEASLPTLRYCDYFMEPSLKELASLEVTDPGQCRRVHNFRVGRVGYGCVQFLGQTDVRYLDLDRIVKFDRHEIVVYEDEKDKPAVGQGLNKPAIVTLIIQLKSPVLEGKELDNVVKKLRSSIERQGAHFISFNPLNGEWKFLVPHFSRFGLTEDDEDDTIMSDATIIPHREEIEDDEVIEVDEETHFDPAGAVLSHSLPAHLGIDPIKMQETRMLMFHTEDEPEEYDWPFSHQKQSFGKEYVRPALPYSAQKISHRDSPPSVRKTPLALLEYNRDGSDPSPPGSILTTWRNKGMPIKRAKVEGFKLDLNCETPITNSHSRNVVDAALFMGRSFRVGWGPNGVLVHTGTCVGKTDPSKGLSSLINVEKVAIDKVVRDENNKVQEELIDLCFGTPLSLHRSTRHRSTKVEIGPYSLELQNIVVNRIALPDICRGYIEIVERQLDVPGLAISSRTFLMHQVSVWELIKVLFSDRELSGHSKPVDVDGEEMMNEKDGSPDIDLEALPLVRRAQFSYWLQESVCHRVQDEISCLNEFRELEHIFLLLTGRQLNAAVEMAASRGDVRLGCLLSQAGGSMVNRSDVARQLELWKINGLDFNFIEKDRLRLYELLAGNIQGALSDSKVDWKRFLGLLMWYQLSPDTSLPVIVDTYHRLLTEERAPYPVPVYIDEGPFEDSVNWTVGDRFDIAYYLMLLHADEEKGRAALKTMFSAFSSTHDPLDYHMIWHQRALLEAVGAFSSNDLHVLDMSLVSQLLSLEQCHWAIYVVLHIPYRDDFPHLQATVVREILFQYCEVWSTQEIQRQFIEDLGIPSEWMHEAMAVYFHYHMDLPKALEHFLESCNWQRSHSIFMTSVGHSLFLSAKHSEIWRLATSMEEHQAEIADWDLGAGLYISFYHLKSSLQDENAMSDLDSLERKNAACKEFFGRLNESLEVWGNKLPVDGRVTYSKMAEEICCLLLSDREESSSCEVQLSSFDTIVRAPLPEDIRTCHLQEAVSLFSFFLSETGSEI